MHGGCTHPTYGNSTDIITVKVGGVRFHLASSAVHLASSPISCHLAFSTQMATELDAHVLADIFRRVGDPTAARGLPAVCKAFQRAWDLIDLHAWLVQQGVGGPALESAARQGRVKDIRHLIAAGADVQAHSLRALLAAAEHQLGQPADPDAADECSHCKVVEMMLQNGADPCEALDRAVIGHAAVVPLLHSQMTAQQWEAHGAERALQRAARGLDVLTAQALVTSGVHRMHFVWKIDDCSAPAIVLMAAGMHVDSMLSILERHQTFWRHVGTMRAACRAVLEFMQRQQQSKYQLGTAAYERTKMQHDAAAARLRQDMVQELLLDPLVPCLLLMLSVSCLLLMLIVPCVLIVLIVPWLCAWLARLCCPFAVFCVSCVTCPVVMAWRRLKCSCRYFDARLC